ncbi:MAG: AI-2E family transporter [Synechococcus sp.]|nr:AI-2E family transporter [Synechococcus sp.]
MRLPRWLRLSLVLPLLGLNLFVLRQVLLRLAPFPALFLAAALIAFLLDIPSRWLQQRGLPRALTLLLVLVSTISGVVLGGVLLVPPLVEQLGELLNTLPSWLVQAQEQLNHLQELAEQRGWPTDLSPFTDNLLARSARLASSISQQLLGLLSATFSITVNTVIVLVLAVFLLLGGESISTGLARWIPADWRPLVVTSMDRTFRGYFAGQVLLAVLLSLAQVVVFTLLQIPYGVLFALLIGFTTLVPYASALTITVVSLGLTLDDPRTGLEVLAAAITVGQVVDQLIAPRLVGTIVGLHPAWVLVSLPLGARLGELLGVGALLGLLLAVPLASLLKTVLDELYLRLQPAEHPAPPAG